MNDIILTGNNETVVIDDKDIYNKTINKSKTVNIVKSDNTEIENDIKAIQSDITKLVSQVKKQTKKLTTIESKIDTLMTKLNSLPVSNVLEREV